MSKECKQIIDCLKIAEKGYTFIQNKIDVIKQKKITPCFATVLVGGNPASKVYVSAKKKKADSLGIKNPLYELPEDITEEDLLKTIVSLNQDKEIQGILVQLPLPKHINRYKIFQTINPYKDIDGLHPYNLGSLLLSRGRGILEQDFNQNYFYPCTPFACLTILHSLTNDIAFSKTLNIIDKEKDLILQNTSPDSLNKNLPTKERILKDHFFYGKHAVVIGRSTLVGLPVGQLLLNNNCTVTYVHSHSKNIKEICKTADILVVAIGVPLFIDSSYIKDDAIIIDVGISKNSEGTIVGDCNLQDIVNKCQNVKITPVPKGVGPLTIMSLMYNAVKAASFRKW